MSARRDRFRDIVETLTKHGLGFALGNLGLDRFRPADGSPGPHGMPPRGVSLPVRVRLALEDLGAVYIKFGQIVSTRTDVLPPEYATELAKLQDASPPIAAEVRSVIADELGTAADRLLDSLDDTPLATGSIGQVHCSRIAPDREDPVSNVSGGPEGAGRLVDVVVKVRRPGVVAQVNEDLEIMAELARRAERASMRAGGVHLVFEDGFFHADPHPGNFFVEEDGRLGIIDFGMVGHISDSTRDQLVRMLLAIVEQDAARLTTALVRMCGAQANGGFDGLQTALGRLVDRYAGRPLAEIPIVAVLAELAALLREHRLRLPRETALVRIRFAQV